MAQTPRTIPLAGVKNFRDMGGYTSADGRMIRWGRIFRSGHLSDMTEDCGTEMLARDIETVIDFRSDAEKVRHPVHWPEGWIPDYHPVPIGGNAAAWVKELYNRLAETDFPARELRDQFIIAFETIPIQNRAGLAQFFDTIIKANKGSALLFHCTAGKDRTGIAGALLMNALDISPDQIMEDFLHTNEAVNLEESTATMAEWLSTKSGRQINPTDVLPLVGVEADFLKASYRIIEKEFGSTDAYLSEGLGITRERKQKLKDILLK